MKTISITLQEFVLYHLKGCPSRSIVDHERMLEIKAINEASQLVAIIPLENNLYDIRKIDEFQAGYNSFVMRKEQEEKYRSEVNAQIEAKANLVEYFTARGRSKADIESILRLTLSGELPNVAEKFRIKVENRKSSAELLDEEL